MPTDRMRSAAKGLQTIEDETGVELGELEEAIEEVQEIHNEHMQEMKLDQEFINDLKRLFKEIKAIRQIDHHMLQEIQHYENGDMSKEEFREAYIQDEQRLEEIVGEVRTELEETVRILSNEERLTNKDLNIEDATQNLVRELNDEEQKLEQAHERVNELITGE